MQSAAASVREHHLVPHSDEMFVRVLWTLIFAVVGLIVGAVVGIGIALVTMSFDPRWDGTYGMREMIVCLPCGALAGLAAGIAWGCRPLRA